MRTPDPAPASPFFTSPFYIDMRGLMNSDSFPLLELPDNCVHNVLHFLDAKSLVSLELTGAGYFADRQKGRRLTLVEEVARDTLLRRLAGSMEAAERFRRRSWRERLHLEESTGVGFDRAFSEDGGFQFQFSPDATALQSVRLTGMGPKLLLSDISTAQQPVLHWQLRVRGNTAVEFGVVPAELPPSHTALHKCMAAPGCPQHRAQGFCSQITAGSLLPLKAPVMRGTLIDIVAQRGHVEVLLRYPADAKEITWQNGQPVQRSYRGPAQLRLEQDFPPTYDVRLALTSWARAHFDVLHDGFEVDQDWAAAAATEQAAAALEAAAPQEVEQHPELAMAHHMPDDLLMAADAAEAHGMGPMHAHMPAAAGDFGGMLPPHQQQQQQQAELLLAALPAAQPVMAAGAMDDAAAAAGALPPHGMLHPAGGLQPQQQPAALAALQHGTLLPRTCGSNAAHDHPAAAGADSPALPEHQGVGLAAAPGLPLCPSVELSMDGQLPSPH